MVRETIQAILARVLTEGTDFFHLLIKCPPAKTEAIPISSNNPDFCACSVPMSPLHFIPHDCSASGHAVSFQPHYNAKTPACIRAYL